MSVTTIALEAIAEAVETRQDGELGGIDDANELAIRVLVHAGVTPDPLDPDGLEELQALLVESILRSPALAGWFAMAAL